ncbi:aspartate/glutamate racemase family protein [Ramlibacter sp. USB13]|uniref:Aspartate/glutamate racemase family protein n=1 Tax=Ramlibacter cellulosilyticus TaxID=2764187 RepID=A0A923MNT3_9BURK|nr:aspartate/glutamate racemase family protein [Ramlibacter cellulosilyticus]
MDDRPRRTHGVYTSVDNHRSKDQNAGNRTSAAAVAVARSPALNRPLRLGVLTPSSNTALEPLTSALVAALPGASAHFSRFRVTEISLDAVALGQFDDSKILAAAELLADAKVDVIGWSGTAAGWLGFDRDRKLVERIRERTGIPATTAVLALNELMALKGIRRLALVTPYTADVQDRIVGNYAQLGIEVVAERHLGIRVNHAFAEVDPRRLRELMDQVAGARPQAITTFCTNLRAAQLAPEIERAHGIPLLDTVSTTVWGMVRAAGGSPAAITGWGELFQWT